MSHSRWFALAVLCAQTLMIVLDQTIVAVALPAIRHDLGFSAAGLAWVVNAYGIAFGGLLLLAGRLGDLFGRRRVFLLGLIVFTAASLGCGLAGNAGVLVVARFVQGVGGAASSAVALGMIAALFPLAAERAKAIGAFSFVQAAGGTLGGFAGGLLTQFLDWHWIFLINLPIGTVTAILAVRVLAADRGTGREAGADVPGAVLVTAALMLGVYTIVESGQQGPAWTVVSVVLLGGFLLRQAKAPNPLLPLRIFSSKALSGANTVMALLVAAMFAFQFVIVLLLRQALDYSAQQTGLALVPVAAAIAVVSLGVSARVITAFGARAALLTGLLLITAGLALLAVVPVDGWYPRDLLPALLAMGIGFGLAMPALMGLGMRDARPEDSGLASGLFNTTQQVAGAIGLSALAVLASSHADTLTARGVPTAQALTAGYHLAFGIGAALVVVAAAMTAVVLRERRPVAA